MVVRYTVLLSSVIHCSFYARWCNLLVRIILPAAIQFCITEIVCRARHSDALLASSAIPTSRWAHTFPAAQTRHRSIPTTISGVAAATPASIVASTGLAPIISVHSLPSATNTKRPAQASITAPPAALAGAPESVRCGSTLFRGLSRRASCVWAARAVVGSMPAFGRRTAQGGRERHKGTPRAGCHVKTERVAVYFHPLTTPTTATGAARIGPSHALPGRSANPASQARNAGRVQRLLLETHARRDQRHQ